MSDPSDLSALDRVADQVVAPDVDSTLPPTTETTAVVAPPVEREYEIKWGGQSRKLKEAELIEHAQKGYDYTQKTQSLAQKEREMSEFLGASKQKVEFVDALSAVLADPAQKAEYIRWLTQGQQAQSVAADPNEVVTRAQLQAQAEAVQSAIARTGDEAVRKALSEFETWIQAKQIETTRDDTLKAIVTEFPLLKDLPGMDKAIFGLAREAKPETIEDMSKALREAGKTLSDAMESRVKAGLKSSAVAQAKLGTSGIEPPGGSSVLTSAKSFFDKKTGRMDWDGFTKSLAKADGV